MGLQDRDYYKEKLEKIEKEQSKRNIFVIIIAILLTLTIIFGLLVF